MVKNSDAIRVVVVSSPTDGFIPMSVDEAQFLIEQGEILLLGFDGPKNPVFIVDFYENDGCILSKEDGEEVIQDSTLRDCLQGLWNEVGYRADRLFYGGKLWIRS